VAVPASGTGKMRRARSIRSGSGPRIAPSVRLLLLVDQEDHQLVAGEQALAAGQDLVEHRRRVGDRVADRLQHLRRWRSGARAPPCVSLNRRAFSIAITAWLAKVFRRSTSRSANTPGSARVTAIAPTISRSRSIGTASTAR
jgi:hypothetical protein